MARADLLALEPEDLAVLANRGIVKRAQAELASGEYTFAIEEADGALTVRWSDEVECLIPTGKGLADGRCSCPATTLCRHLVRSVLAYQREHGAGQTGGVPQPSASSVGSVGSDRFDESASPAPTPDPESGSQHPTPKPQYPTPPAPWDPGAISDDDLARHFRATELARARRQFEEGHVLELVRGLKPSAYVHTLSLNLRFMIPGDLRYTHCDCSESPPCSHVPMAIWAFRLLSPEREGGLVSTRREAMAVPASLFAEIERALVELAMAGIQAAPGPLVDRLRRLENGCREKGLTWPAEILAELVQQKEAYRSHDARFSPERVAGLVGELCIRMDAIGADTGAVPQLFIRGARADRAVDVGHAQMVGLGCAARPYRGGVELSAYLQDDRSGAVVAVCREFPDPPADASDLPKEFRQLAHTPAMPGITFAALGAGRLQVQGGKRTPSSRFVPGRSRASLTPHALQWEKQVRPPLLAEDFAELAARLSAQPPASLRPRRIGTRLHVCPVAGVDDVRFSESDQAIAAVLWDAAGSRAVLVHHFLHRARHGAELLLSRLQRQGEGLRFVAAEATLTGAGLVLRPTSAVFETDGARTLVQPWIDGPEVSGDGATAPHPEAPPARPDPVGAFAGELMEAAGEQWLLGLDHADAGAARAWRRIQERGEALGFHRLVVPVERIGAELEKRARTVRWDAEPAARALLDLGVLTSLANERTAASG